MTATSTRPISIATTASEPRVTVSPKQLGSWSLLGLLTRGSVADLYLAEAANERSSKSPRYVLKALRPEWREHALVRQQLHTEAVLGRQLQSPHLTTVLDSELQGETPYLVMPRIEGNTIVALQRRGAPIPLALKLAIIRQAALALAAIHAAEYLHGDLKPENMLLSPAGHLTLIDLGSARPIRESGAIWNRPVMGSPAYLAPELFTSSMPGDARSDLYSLGVLGYELLAERHPYAQGNVADYALAAKQVRPVVLRQLAPQVPSAVAELIEALLAKQPSRRPSSAAEVVDRLLTSELAAWQNWVAA